MSIDSNLPYKSIEEVLIIKDIKIYDECNGLYLLEKPREHEWDNSALIYDTRKKELYGDFLLLHLEYAKPEYQISIEELRESL